MSQLREVKVVNPKGKKRWDRMFPDLEVARIKSLTKEQILDMTLSEIEHAAKVGNLYAGRFLAALAERFNPKPV